MISRRSLLALGAGLIVGEPARRAYSFLTNNPLAATDSLSDFVVDKFTMGDRWLEGGGYELLVTYGQTTGILLGLVYEAPSPRDWLRELNQAKTAAQPRQQRR